MALYICPSARWGSGQQLWLPPWMTIAQTQSQRLTIHQPAGANQALIAAIEENEGSNLEISVDRYLPLTPNAKEVLDWQRNIWTALKGKKFTLNYYNSEAWEDCALAQLGTSIGQDDETKAQYVLRLRASVFCEHPVSSKSAGIAFASLAAYESGYPFAGQVGRPGGTPTGTSPAEFSPMVIPFEQHFAGAAEVVTPVGFEFLYTVPGGASDTYRVSHAKIVGSDNFDASGSTVVRVSTFAVGGTGDSITATVLVGATTSAQGSDFFDVAGGSNLYVAITTAGGHSNTAFRFDVEAQ